MKLKDNDLDSSNSEVLCAKSNDIFMLSLFDSYEDKDDFIPHLYQSTLEELVRFVATDVIGAEVSVK